MPSDNAEYISAFRIVAPRWADDAFSGEGARKFGGRWNSPGNRVIYTGGSRSLSALEMLVHLTTPLSRAKPYCIIEVKIPTSSLARFPASALPEDWRKSPPSKRTMEIGDDWLTAGSHLALQLPSVLIPEEVNYLINPLHPEFQKLKLGAAIPFHFDARL